MKENAMMNMTIGELLKGINESGVDASDLEHVLNDYKARLDAKKTATAAEARNKKIAEARTKAAKAFNEYLALCLDTDVDDLVPLNEVEDMMENLEQEIMQYKDFIKSFGERHPERIDAGFDVDVDIDDEMIKKFLRGLS